MNIAKNIAALVSAAGLSSLLLACGNDGIAARLSRCGYEVSSISTHSRMVSYDVYAVMGRYLASRYAAPAALIDAANPAEAQVLRPTIMVNEAFFMNFPPNASSNILYATARFNRIKGDGVYTVQIGSSQLIPEMAIPSKELLQNCTR